MASDAPHCRCRSFAALVLVGRSLARMDLERIHTGSYRIDQHRTPPASAVEYTQLRADIATRLGRVCSDMPREAFDALIDDIFAMKVRWARTATAGRDD